MEAKIKECLNNKIKRDHILPFFWQHGEDHDTLLREIEAIKSCGIREFCVESRTYEQFGQQQWWEDFRFMLKAAKERNMGVWLLDDKHFPSGYANNYIAEHRELRKVSLRVEYRDFAGPVTGAGLVCPQLYDEESVAAVVAYERREQGSKLSGEGIVLTDRLCDGLIKWDIPKGIFRVYYMIRTKAAYTLGGTNYLMNYIDMLSKPSCMAMIHAVYEPHFEHFHEYFGNTFKGFFSDEPCFANRCADYNTYLGRHSDLLVPWRDDLIARIAEESGKSEEEITKLLPALWHEIEGKTSVLREAYMEVVTKLYEENFSHLLGDWCREHGVQYIGHIIEDMNTHQRLGCGAGHYFRALSGQDMAGIDVVLHQIVPGFLELNHTASVTECNVDPTFFQYTLAKLGASHAHIDKKKNGRAMCEVYGAFGWAEGVPFMKYLTDFMLVNGINYYVPHAFTPKFPDPDCPPHFYANGHNPQFSMFSQLMQYLARMCHALSDGVHVADVAVYYNAEAEWSGGKNMLQQEVCKALTRSFIDFDILPQDTVLSDISVKNGKISILNETYGALIVPYSQYLPQKLIKRFFELSKSGVSVIFVNALPERTSEGAETGGLLASCEVIPFKNLCATLKDRGLCHFSVKNGDGLRFYHFKRNGKNIYMFFNESAFDTIDTQIPLSNPGGVFYDAWQNTLLRPKFSNGALRLRLLPQESIVYIEDGADGFLPPFDYGDGEAEAVNTLFDISLKAENKTEFKFLKRAAVGDLSGELNGFSGTIQYETDFIFENPDDLASIELGTVGETAELWVNGEYCGSAVGALYRFTVDGKLKKGNNKLTIRVIPNLGYKMRDSLSSFLPLPPSGILGPVVLRKKI